MALSLHCVSSDIRTKDGAILSGVSYLVAVSVFPPTGGLDCAVTIRDCAPDATAPEIAAAKALAIVCADNTVDVISSKHFCPALPIKAVNGLYVDGISLAGGEAVLVHCFSKDGNAVIPEAE